ncbi:MAG: hypothetical protein AAF587_18535 [Bacteroidota bacterium]
MKRTTQFIFLVVLLLGVLSSCSPEQRALRKAEQIRTDLEGKWEVTAIQLSSGTDEWDAPQEELGTFEVLPCQDETSGYCSAIRVFPSGLTFEFGFQVTAYPERDEASELSMFVGTAPSNEVAWTGIFSVVSMDEQSLRLHSDGPAATARNAETILIQAVRAN